MVDLNKDGAAEIIVSTKRGTFIFWNNWKRQSRDSSNGHAIVKPASPSC